MNLDVVLTSVPIAAPALEQAEMKPIVWPRTDVGKGSVAVITTVLDKVNFVCY